MYRINRSDNTISKIEKKKFSELGFKERDNLQEWIANNPEALGEELLIIQKEFSGFDETRERLDLLALDKRGNLVIIENKLDDTGRDVVWQALKYVSYCSTLKKDQIVSIYQQYLDNKENANEKISDFIGEDLEVVNLNKSQRMFLIANEFRKEVTSTVLWLIDHQVQIQCIKVNPFEINGELLLNIEQIIPVPEISEYMISMSLKESEERTVDIKRINKKKFNEEFWTLLRDKLEKSECDLFDNKTPSKELCWANTGPNKLNRYSFYLNKSDARVEFDIYFDDMEESNKAFDELIQYKEQVHSVFSEELIWLKKPEQKSSKVQYIFSCDRDNKDTWGEISDKLVDGIVRLEKAINSVLPQIKKTLNIT